MQIGTLVLSRKPGQTVKIGDDIEIAIKRVNGDRVQLVFMAPRDLRIVRGELLEREAA